MPHRLAFRLQPLAAGLAAMLIAHVAPALGQGSTGTPVEALRSAARAALESNPDLTARASALRAAGHERASTEAGWRPRVAATGEAGYTRDRLSERNPADQGLSRAALGLSVTQMLWDGHATRSEVQRLNHARTARAFELLDSAEQVALEAARAHYDVLRFRRLVALAEDNYVQHRASHELIQSRVKSGVGRGVDLEQVVARLALAESNLNSEVANLHDVTARYHRIVGIAPPAQGALEASLRQALPGSPDDAVRQASERSAAVSAAIETQRGLRAQREGVKAGHAPRVEVRAHGQGGHNVAGMRSQKSNLGVELTLNWTLADGGRDHFRERQLADLQAQAADQRDRACRDARQVAAIAWNDAARLAVQLKHLETNTQAIQRAREAYRQQFEIGQRSLLDLLNADNEVYTARRQWTNAEHDLHIAWARTHAAVHTLLPALGLARPLPPAEAGETDAVSGWRVEGDGAQRCGVLLPVATGTPIAELDRRAAAQAAERPAASPGTAPAPGARAPR